MVRLAMYPCTSLSHFHSSSQTALTDPFYSVSRGTVLVPTTRKPRLVAGTDLLMNPDMSHLDISAQQLCYYALRARVHPRGQQRP